MSLSDFFRELTSIPITPKRIINLSYEFGDFLSRIGFVLLPIKVTVSGPLGWQFMACRLVINDSNKFSQWVENSPSREELVALRHLFPLVAEGLREVGFSGLSDDDREMIRGAEELARAFLDLGLEEASCFFGALSRADDGGYLEAFLLLEGFTDYPWVRPRPGDWAHLPIPILISRSQMAAANIRSICERLAEFPTEAHPRIWALIRRLSDTFDSPPITRRLSEALDAISGTAGAEHLADALTTNISYIKMIPNAESLNVALES
jgi:hypothetical protein